MNKSKKRHQKKLARKATKKNRRQPPQSPGPAAGGVPPDTLSGLFLKAVQLHHAGQSQEAEAVCQQVLDADPSHADANHLLGILTYQAGNHEQAVSHYRKALANYSDAAANKPAVAGTHSNLGNALQELGQLDDAVAHYQQAISLKPDLFVTHNNLGNALRELRRLDDAVACYEKSISLQPDYVEAHNNLGTTLKDLGQLDNAVTSFEKAIALKPDLSEAHNNLGNVLASQGEWVGALASYRRALDLNPSLAFIHSNLIFYQDFFMDIDQAAQQDERKRWNEAFILPLGGNIKPHANDRDPGRRLRIGYVSADFKTHSACQGFAPLILDHDRNRFEVFCYDGNAVQDAMTETLRQAAASWRQTLGMSDETLAETIRKDGIDILVDLSGHTKRNRLVMFGHKPAPIQVTGIGHLAPGISTIDYRLTTAFATPPDEEDIYPETPVYLSTHFCFMAPPDAPDVGSLPSLDNGHITFGCLNRLKKVTDESLALWAKILADVPDSRMLFKDPYLDEPANRQRLEDFFSGHGIAEDRLVLLGGTPQPEHLDAYNRVDIALDPIPYGGGITTLESLWMGVPVLGRHDPRKISTRIIKYVCQPLGLDDWIAENNDEYHQMAVEWASQPEALTDIRLGLRRRVSEIYSRFPDDVGNAYRIMWERWCADEPTQALDLAGSA